MKTITINAIPWDVKSLYQESSTPTRRALLGYMLKTGNTNDATLGGAFSLIRDIEMRNGKLYRIVSQVSHKQEKEIISIAETAMAGGLKSFALTKREIKSTLRHISDFI
jgi:hypothetical protein